MVDTATYLISAGGVAMSAVALWRSGRVRVLDRRTELLKDLADLRPRLEALELIISGAVQSRRNAAAASWNSGLTGTQEEFEHAAAVDVVSVGVLRAQLEETARLPLITTYGGIEARQVRARDVRTRYEQFFDKYNAARQSFVAIVEESRVRFNVMAGLGKGIR